MARQPKSESKLTEATDKATALIQGLQSRLNREMVPVAAASIPHEETSEELDRQLREYFVASDVGMLAQIRDRVIDAVADRVLQSWERGDRRELGALEKQVIDRVAERILERMSKT
ncbi:MAG TPA: hypothetical protein VE958_08565 [Bryobacteraceae bacterium]|nr:hypothetical protein [Bryobacteraceae bacterium]